jgi:hypothetical protein
LTPWEYGAFGIGAFSVLIIFFIESPADSYRHTLFMPCVLSGRISSRPHSSENQVDATRCILKRCLNWVRNSVFEGELARVRDLDNDCGGPDGIRCVSGSGFGLKIQLRFAPAFRNVNVVDRAGSAPFSLARA